MSTDANRLIDGWIEKGGGAGQIARASHAYDRPIGAKSVYKWAENGIPDWHWPMMMDLCGATLAELHAATHAVRGEKRKRRSRNGSRALARRAA